MQGNTEALDPNEFAQEVNEPNAQQLFITNEMIAVAAYFKAEKRGFTHGFEEQDCFQAEHEIDAMLNS